MLEWKDKFLPEGLSAEILTLRRQTGLETFGAFSSSILEWLEDTRILLSLSFRPKHRFPGQLKAPCAFLLLHTTGQFVVPVLKPQKPEDRKEVNLFPELFFPFDSQKQVAPSKDQTIFHHLKPSMAGSRR